MAKGKTEFALEIKLKYYDSDYCRILFNQLFDFLGERFGGGPSSILFKTNIDSNLVYEKIKDILKDYKAELEEIKDEEIVGRKIKKITAFVENTPIVWNQIANEKIQNLCRGKHDEACYYACRYLDGHNCIKHIHEAKIRDSDYKDEKSPRFNGIRNCDGMMNNNLNGEDLYNSIYSKDQKFNNEAYIEIKFNEMDDDQAIIAKCKCGYINEDMDITSLKNFHAYECKKCNTKYAIGRQNIKLIELKDNEEEYFSNNRIYKLENNDE